MPVETHVPCKRKIDIDADAVIVVEDDPEEKEQDVMSSEASKTTNKSIKMKDKKETGKKSNEKKSTENKATGKKPTAKKATDKKEGKDKEGGKEDVNKVVDSTDYLEPSTPDDSIVNKSANESPCKSIKPKATTNATN